MPSSWSNLAAASAFRRERRKDGGVPPELGDVANWSNPAAWPSGEVPVEGENVLIDETMYIT